MQCVRTIRGPLFALVAVVLLAAPAATAGDGVVVEVGPVPFLGVRTAPSENGVRVTNVVRGTAAEAAGLRQGDVIVEFAGRPVETVEQLVDLVRAQLSGDAVDVTVMRDGGREALQTELGQRDGGTRLELDGEYWVWSPHMRGRVKGEIGVNGHHDTSIEDIFLCPSDESCAFGREAIWYRADCVGRGCQRYEVRYFDKAMLGVEIVETTPELSRHMGGEAGGVLIGNVMAGSPAEEAGIEVGDLIVVVDGEPTGHRDALSRAIRAGAGGNLDVEVIRDGRTRNLRVWIEKPGPAGPRR